jgi:hypothetical protein
MKLTMALASRGRPDLLLRTVRRTAENMVLPDTTFLVCLDEDDKRSLSSRVNDVDLVDYLKTIDSRIRVSIKPREDSRGEKYDRALTEAPADIYLPTCDYSALVTPGFDKLIVDAAQTFPDGIGIVNTQMANLSFPHYQAMTAKLVAKLGYIYPHHFPFWFIDHWMDDIGRMIDRVAYADVECKPEPIGGTHKTIGMRDLEFWANLYDVGQVERNREARSLMQDMDIPAWRKAKLEWEFQFVHQRSMGINNNVRAHAENIEKSRGGVESEADERYKRIKARADDLMQKWHWELTAQVKGLHLVSDNSEPQKVPAAPNPLTMSPDELKQFIGEKVPGPENAQRVICLALLAYDSRIFTRTMMCLMNSVAACATKGWGFTVLMRDADSMVARGRSLLASQFLENPGAKQCSDLVMVDTDLAWDGQGDNNEFAKLCSHNVDVVGGTYPFKDESGDFPLRWPADGLYEREDGLWEVQAATPGFFRMTRKALEKIAREMPWLEFKDKPTAQDQRQWMFFDNLHRPAGVYDEGYVFCERWRTVGGKVYLDPDLNLTHIGTKAFNHGTLREWLSRKAAVIDKLQSEYPGIPPLVLGKAAMGEKVDLEAEMAKLKPESAA